MRPSSRTVALAVGAIVVVGLGVGLWRLAAPVQSGGSQASGPESTLDQVRDVLRARAARLANGDVEGYLKPLGPQARAVEEPIARRAVTVPLTSIGLVLNPPPSVSENAPAFRNVPVTLTFGYQGLPEDNPFSLAFVDTIEKVSGSWTETSSAVAPNQEQPMWALGPVRVSHSDHFLALSDPDLKRIPDALNLAETARGNLAKKLPLGIDQVQLMELAANSTQFDQVSGQTAPPDALAYETGDPGPAGAEVARHIVVDMSTLFGPTALVHSQELPPLVVFQHELGHLALTRYDGPATPNWVQEAAAEYLSGDRPMSDWKTGLAEGVFDRLSFAGLGAFPNIPAEAYPYVAAGADYLVQNFGATHFLDFYRGYKLQGGTADPTDTLLNREFGLDSQQLDANTRAWIRATVASG